MKNLISTLLAQLPSSKLHALGSTALVVALGLLGYYEYVGDAENAKYVLVAVLGLLVPAPLHSRNPAEDAQDAP